MTYRPPDHRTGPPGPLEPDYRLDDAYIEGRGASRLIDEGFDPLTETWERDALTFSSELARLAGSADAVVALANLNPSLKVLLAATDNFPSRDRIARRIVEIMLARDDDDEGAES